MMNTKNIDIREVVSSWKRIYLSLTPKTIVLISFFLILTELLILILVNPVFYRDSSAYINLVEAFRQEAWERAFSINLPVLYTLLAGAVAKLGLSAQSALLLISGLATALTVFPIYGLLKLLIPRKQAAWCTLLFALSPPIIQTGCAPLIDSGRFLFMLLGMYLIFAEDVKFTFFQPLLLGGTYAALILVRDEGIILVGVLCTIHFLLRFIRREKRGFQSMVAVSGRMLLPLFVSGILVSPRLIQVMRLTGYPAIGARQIVAIETFTKEFLLRVCSTQEFNLRSAEKMQFSGGQISLGHFASLHQQKRFWSSFFNGFQLLYLPFTILGIFVLLRQKRWRYEFSLLLLTLLLYNLLHFILRQDAGRYFLINSCFSLPFTISGLVALFEWGRTCRFPVFQAMCAGLIITACVLIFKSLRNLGDGKERCFKTAGFAFQPGNEAAQPLVSGQKRPVVLFVGADRGFGNFANVNVVNYTDYPWGLASAMTVEAIVHEGIPGKYAGFWLDRNVPERILIDAVAVLGKQWSPTDGVAALFREIPLTEPGSIQIYQVLNVPGNHIEQEK